MSSDHWNKLKGLTLMSDDELTERGFVETTSTDLEADTWERLGGNYERQPAALADDAVDDSRSSRSNYRSVGDAVVDGQGGASDVDLVDMEDAVLPITQHVDVLCLPSNCHTQKHFSSGLQVEGAELSAWPALEAWL